MPRNCYGKKGFVQKIRTYVRDATEMIEKIENELDRLVEESSSSVSAQYNKRNYTAAFGNEIDDEERFE
jgi:hypothetical protein